MNTEELKKYLSKEYQGSQSFLENIIYPIFGEEDFIDGFESEILDNYPEFRKMANDTGIRSVKDVGMIYIDGEPLQIFDISVSDRIKMERNRVTIQSLIRRIMDQYSNAFMLFHYEDITQWTWRFTYCHKSANKEESTDSKRYTFLLGPNQSCRTAADNFVKLYDNRTNLTLKNIEDAFSVEALSDEFFKGYKKIYEDIIEHITGKRMVKKNNKWEEEENQKGPNSIIMQEFSHFANPEKAVRDYVKKLMGRLVFLQFLQKKGWLGVPADKLWGEGSRSYIEDLFNRTEDKDTFVDNVLEILFNDLNTERANDLVSPALGNNIRVPYLNGGLFERDAADETNFFLPEKYMRGLLEFFSCYNFTIDENDPDDSEVGVDPEMLGRIFENLLEDNKDKGAFYTPKEIVSYMCRESLIAYLQIDVEDDVTKECIRHFVTTHDASLLGNIANEIDLRLKNVKICDPAIGSGAFPMGLLKELFQCRTALEGIDQSKAAEIKKHIIQNNIYGVDIEKGAVDIARLRFWLSLIVDEETPQALPNLDFKIMQGNSLLEQYKGVDLSTITELKTEKHGTYQTTMFDDMIDVLRLDLRKKLDEYYSCPDHKKKAVLKKDIIDNVKQQLKEQSIHIDFGNLDLAGNDQFMLWHTWFYDVFSQGGFDIVIGNPPYVSSKVLPLNDKVLYKKLYYTAEKQFDLYSLFAERGIQLLREEGISSYIVPDSIIGRSNFAKIREILILDNKITKWIHLNNVFDSAIVSSLIYVCHKQKSLSYVFDYNRAENVKSWINGDIKTIKIFSDEVGSELDKKIVFADLDKISLQNKLKDSDNFGTKCVLWRGEEIGKGSDLIQDIRTSSCYPIITGKEAHRYGYPKGTKWIHQNNVVKSLKKYLHPKILIRQVGDHINATFDNESGITTQSVYALYPKEERDNSHAKALVGILNSKLFDFFYRLVSGDKQMFKRIILENVKALPYPNMDNLLILDIEKIVDEILIRKRGNPSIDTSDMESEIDNLVYHLYGLTYDEVLIVDPETPINREHYESN